MFWDWVLREGWMLPTWWLMVTLAGVAAFPLCVRLLSGLPDRGYTVARTVGMLLVAFVYWILASYGFINNSTNGMILAWLIVLVVALVAYFGLGEGINWRDYWRENNRVVIAAEVLFITFFVLMFVYRAYQNDTFTTEKPMEMNFISGIMRSETFPPNDPWMAGYSISYYYFGYVMTAMLTMLSGLNSGFGFSMMISLTYALAALTVFGVAYNLVRSRALNPNSHVQQNIQSRRPAILVGTLATTFVLLMGNFQFSLIEVPYRSQSAPASYFEWWGMRGFTDMESIGYSQENNLLTITTPLDNPQAWGRDWWWWHTSRILEDYDINGNAQEIIDEVPAFSFILNDLHPHVLALPFVALAIGLAINIVLLGRDPTRYEIVLYGLVVGGLFFLNAWDGPVYFVILLGADALRRVMRRDGFLNSDDWANLIVFGAIMGGIALVAYLPFLISFRSQAGGLIPNLIAPTPFRLYFLMFGPMLLLSGAFLLGEIWRGSSQKRLNWRLGLMVSGSIFLGLFALLAIFVLVGWLVPSTRTFVNQLLQSSGGWSVVLPEVFSRQLGTIILRIVLFVGLGAIVARLFPKVPEHNQAAVQYTPATGIALLLLAAALGITLVPEFVYLRDNFGTRINTIFKFYYQAWMLFGIVSAYGVYAFLFDTQSEQRTPAVTRLVYSALLALVLIACVPYSFLGMYNRAILEQQRHVMTPEQQAPLTLDGRGDSLSPDYFAAVQCLGILVQGDDVVVAEASQNTYNSPYGRLGAFYGLPTVINWENHQRQWRGSTYAEVAGTRRQDIDRLYNDLRWDIVLPIIDQYEIDYIMYGQTERNQYGEGGEDKFRENLIAICEFGQVRVYAVNTDIVANTTP